MTKTCARPGCGKTVYPTEELNCLDKVWHKSCFKCSTCGMTLNMKNYKGYEKNPYCDAHYPKTKASVVADTPEMRRLAETTKNQSLVKYHEEFEKSKGKKTEIADDPEIFRHVKNTQNISNAAYHGIQTDGASADGPTRHHIVVPHQPLAAVMGGDPNKASPYSTKQQQMSTLIYSSEQGGRQGSQMSPRVGSIADYDPMNGQFSSIVSGGGRPLSGGEEEPEIRAAPVATPFASMGYIPGQTRNSHNPTAAAAPIPHADSRLSNDQYRAMFDYSAADADEVSFQEGDIIINVKRVDDGWMTGTVAKTNKYGMLPANYVEKL